MKKHKQGLALLFMRVVYPFHDNMQLQINNIFNKMFDYMTKNCC